MTHARACTIPLFAAGAASLAAIAGCDRHEASDSSTTGAAMPPPAWFVEAAGDAGLDFVHQSGHADRFFMPEIMGGGAALVDVDEDGDLDAYLIQGGSITARDATGAANRLYLNRGDGTFDDVTETHGADDTGYGMGVCAGDYDNDGAIDLFVTNVGSNVLLNNLGNGRFRDVTTAAGLGHAGWGTSAAFLDYDRDGDLDLMVSNYLLWSPGTEIDCYNKKGAPDYCSPQNYSAPAPDLLYRNNGDGTFTDVSDESGIGALGGTGLGVVAGDFNADGWIDIFVANDGMPDRLWVNNHNGAFEDQAMIAGCAIDYDGRAKAGMGVTAADIDDDADLDLMVCNLYQESDSVFRNEGQYFSDATVAIGLGAVSRPFTRFGMAWVDFDNDGRLDLFQANGRVAQQGQLYGDDPFAEPNLLYRGTDSGSFREVTPRGGTQPLLAATSRAAAFGDVDGDGGIDILIVNRDGAAHLLMNRAPKRGNWIGFDVRERGGRAAIGATCTMSVADPPEPAYPGDPGDPGAPDRTVVRDVRSAFSYLAANDLRIHVGLGDAAGVSSVRIRWADGAETDFGSFDGGAVHVLSREAN